MNKTVSLLAGLLSLSLIFLAACQAARETLLVPIREETNSYRNLHYGVSLVYPSDWLIESESFQSAVIVPQKEVNWQPDTPFDIPKNPRVRVDFGDYIRERLGPASFPEKVDASSLRVWLREKVANGEAQDLVESTINGIPAFELTELYEPGCEKVVYWRSESLSSLVRVSTGCDSKYLDGFSEIVKSLQRIR